MVFRSFRQVKPVSFMPALLIFTLLGVIVFQYAVLQCAASDSGTLKAVWVDREAYSPGETVLVSVNGTFFNGSNLTAYIISPSLAFTELALSPSKVGYTAEYSPQQDVVLGTYAVFVSGEDVAETAEFDIRMLSIAPDLEKSYPLGNISISGNVTDTATGNPVNASVHIMIDGMTLSTSAIEGFFSTAYQAVSTGQKAVNITAIDNENITGTATASFEVSTLSGDPLNPVINSVSDTPDPIERGGYITFTANITDNVEIGTVLVEINGTEYPMSPPELWMNRTGLFFEGFESGSLATNNWTVSGTGEPWQVEEGVSKSYEGTFNALASGSGEKILETEIDTEGYENLTLSLYYGISGLSGSGYFAVDWYDGEQWNSISNFSGHTVQYTYLNSSLPEGACDNPDFKLRFRCSLGPGDTARIDSVELKGTEILCKPYGYIYDTSGLSPGVYSYTVRATDLYGNEADKLTGSFTVVAGIPGILLVSDSPDPVVWGENIKISVDLADGFEVNAILVNIGGMNHTVAEGVNTVNELFFDGFESGILETNNWTCSGTGIPWFLDYKPNKAYEGDFSLLVTNTDGSGESGASSLETGINTSGYSEINLSFYYKPGGLSVDKLEYFSVDWYDGEAWNNLLNTSGIKNEYLFFNSVLPAAAGDNPDFKIRFNCYSTNPDASIRIDNVEVGGKRIVSGPFEFLFNSSILPPGVYDYTVYANDTFGLDAAPATGNFTVQEPFSPGGGTGAGDTGSAGEGGFETPDSVSPVINSVSDAPDPVERGENVYINANITDDVGVGTVLVEINGTNYSMEGVSSLDAYTFVIQPGAWKGKDAYIGDGILLDFGSLDFLHIGNEWRGLLEFDLSGLPANAFINSAGLELYYYGDFVPGPGNIGAFRLTNSWDEMHVTWSMREFLLPWGNLGGDFDPTAEDTLIIDSSFGWYEWNITGMVRGWHNGTYPNHGVILRHYMYIQDNGKYFYSSDYSNPGYQPRLTVNYSLSNDSDLWQLTFDTSPLSPGVYNYTVYANDSAGNAAFPLSGNFTVINLPPYLSPIGPRTVNESELLTIKLSATDPDGDPITYGSNASFGNLTGDTFTWIPGFTDSGVYYVEFTASDGEMNDSEKVTITVNESYVNFSVNKIIEKGASPDSFSVALTLTSHVDFNGSGIMVYDLLPENFTFSDSVPACSGSQGDVYYWSLDLAAGESRTVTYILEGTGRYSLGDAFVVGVGPQ